MTAEKRKVLWITGAGNGIGRASAIRSSRRRWSVALTGRRDGALRATARLVTEARGHASVARADVSDPVGLAATYREINDCGQVSSLVLAAGLNARRCTWDDQSLTTFVEIVGTNLAAAAAIDLALPALRASSGMIVVVSFIAAWRLSPLAGAAYSGSTVRLSSLGESLTDQKGPNGIRACRLCPGMSTATFSSSTTSCRMPTRASRCSTRTKSLRPVNSWLIRRHTSKSTIR